MTSELSSGKLTHQPGLIQKPVTCPPQTISPRGWNDSLHRAFQEIGTDLTCGGGDPTGARGTILGCPGRSYLANGLL